MPTRVLPRKIPGPKPPPVIPPEPPSAPTIGAPTGTIPRGKIGGGGPWSLVNRFDPLFLSEGQKHSVPPAMLKSMMIVETGGKDVSDPFGATGVMQIKPKYWGAKANAAGYDLATDAGQIGMAAAMLGGSIPGVRGATPMERFLYTYYPVLNDDGSVCYDCRGESGHTPRMYLDDIALYSKLINEAAGVPSKPPDPDKPKPRDIVDIIVGGRPTDDRYGWKHPTDLPFYDYFEGHGGHANQHTGIDATTVKGQTLYTPIAGKIVCAGTDKGPGAWGSGCAAFGDTMGNGAGRIEILTPDEQHSLILGHCSDALVDVGDVVEIEDPVARAGGYNGWHVHIERRRFTGGSQIYVLEDPRLFNEAGTTPGQPAPELPAFTFLESPNRMSRQGRAPLAIVYHVSDDLNTANVLSWLRKPGSNASSHWVIDRDGSAYQLVGSAFAAFTNGKVERPRMDIPWLAARADAFIADRENANWYCITIEHIGKPDVPFTPEQIATSVAISRYYLHVYPSIPRVRGHMMRHADFDSVDRPYCPGPLFPLREVILACDGDPDRMAA
jgi:N-acetyl-anhydromuramyl-L-alanine amidase AmpD